MQERHKYILNQLLEREIVKTSDLAESLDVSTVTIRNDLQYLHNQGRLIKTHGGAIPSEKIFSHNTSFNYRQFQNITKKKVIVSNALKEVRNGQTIMLDASSTCLLLAGELNKFEQLTVVTNGIYSMLVLKDFPQITTIFVGGIVTHNSGSTEGTLGIDILKSINIDVAFTSPHSISMETGLSDFNYYEVQLKDQMLERAQRVVVLVDSTKYDKGSVASYLDIDKIDKIYTDDELNPRYVQELDNLEIDIELCEM